MSETKEAPRQRGVGPVEVAYIAHDGRVSPRAEAPAHVRFKVKATGETHEVDLSELSEATIRTLAAQMIEKHIQTYVRNHADDEGVTPHGLVVKRASEIASGTVHSRALGTGGSRKKAVDVTPWVEAYEHMLKSVKKPVTPEALAHFREKLETMQGVERNKFIAGMKAKHAPFKAACLHVAAARAKAATKTMKEELNFDEFLA